MAKQGAKVHRILAVEDDIKAGAKVLARSCEVMGRVLGETGPPPLRRRVPGFEGLSRIIVAQQLSVASANAIWGRFEAALQPLDAQHLLLMTDAQLQACGLSRPKIRTLRGLSQAIRSGALDLDALTHASEADVHERLRAVSGIGPWTADVFVMFCLGRADAFASGDLALQVAAQMALGLTQRPTAVELLELAERWRPWRGVAARALWAYYSLQKAKAGIDV